MSHEFRTPLNAILGFAQVLDISTIEPLQPEQKKGIEQILKGGWHLLDVVNGLLDLAAIEANKLELHIDVIDLVAAMKESMDVMQPLAKQRDVTLSSQVEDVCAGVFIKPTPYALSKC